MSEFLFRESFIWLILKHLQSYLLTGYKNNVFRILIFVLKYYVNFKLFLLKIH